MLFNFSIRLISLLAALVLGVATAPGQALTLFKNCKLVPTAWADGDSFEIEAADGVRKTIRLYGADCIEWHVSDETDARRLREQRRYFGMTEVGGSPQASMQAAKELGEAAAGEVSRALAQPFTVHTAFADAMGDGLHKPSMKLPGVGEATANRIIEARPFKTPKDLLKVEGIGPKTWARLAPFLEIQ